MDFLSQNFTIHLGITTLVGGGTGPADGTRATTCTPAPSQMKLMLQATDDLPLNFGFTGKVYLNGFVLPYFILCNYYCTYSLKDGPLLCHHTIFLDG